MKRVGQMSLMNFISILILKDQDVQVVEDVGMLFHKYVSKK